MSTPRIFVRVIAVEDADAPEVGAVQWELFAEVGSNYSYEVERAFDQVVQATLKRAGLE